MASSLPATKWTAAIVVMFLAGNCAWFAWIGVRSGGDTPRYLDGATRLLEGRSLADIQAVHAAYIALIAACQAVRLGLPAVVLVQIGAAALAVVAVHRLGCALSGPAAGLIAALLFVCDVESARWHTFILTDSLYLSLIPIAVWSVHRFTATAFPDWRRSLAAGLSLTSLALLRLEGWLVPPVAAVYWALGGPGRRRRRVAGVAAVMIGAAFWIASMPRVRANVDGILPVESFLNGQTIWGSDQWTLTMPIAPDAGGERHGVPSGVRYAIAHPAETFALMLARVAVHAAHVRPFYSVAHNLLILAWLVPVYGCALRGWWRIGTLPLARWSLAVIGVQAAIVAITHADWDGRPLAHVLPLIYVFSACGIARASALDRSAVSAEDGRRCSQC